MPSYGAFLKVGFSGSASVLALKVETSFAKSRHFAEGGSKAPKSSRQVALPISFEDNRHHLPRRDVELTFPDVEIIDIVHAIVVFNLD
jgi:hypothetical protein